MIEINLLPWRDEIRQQKKKDLLLAIVPISLVLLISIFALNYKLNDWISHQSACNQQLQQEIFALDKELIAINLLKEQKEKLITNFNQMKKNQESNLTTAHLLDEIIRIIPTGVYLKVLRKKLNKIYIVGSGEQNHEIYSFIRRAEHNPWLNEVKLVEIKKKPNQEKECQFKLSFILKPKDESLFIYE